jgi:hypothetical protein
MSRGGKSQSERTTITAPIGKRYLELFVDLMDRSSRVSRFWKISSLNNVGPFSRGVAFGSQPLI